MASQKSSGAAMSPQLRAAIGIVGAIADAIRDLGRPVPAGHLYAIVCGKLSLEEFNQIIAILVNAGIVTKNGDMLETAPSYRKGVQA